MTSLELRSSRIEAVVSENERFRGNCYIMAAGSHSPLLLRKVGVQIPVHPAKGYSITIDNGAPVTFSCKHRS